MQASFGCADVPSYSLASGAGLQKDVSRITNCWRMIKDRVFKTVLIPVLGILIPFGTGLFNTKDLGLTQLVFSLVFFVFVTHITWQGSVNMIAYLRARKYLRKNVYFKLAILVLVTGLYGGGAFFISTSLWQWIVWKQVSFAPLIKIAGMTAMIMLMLTLVYETIFLSAEVEIDAKVIQQLDYERLQAEASLVQKDLDPHFLFNCLNSLSYLVRNEPDRAYQFVHKLSNVFKYLLINKQKDFVPLSDELQFVQDYYFLLQVRFDDAIQIKNTIDEGATSGLIPPCTLQMLLENAIKQNFFSEKEPLVITISMENNYINVSNVLKPKPYKNGPNNQGLAAVKTRFSHLLNEEVLVLQESNRLLVKVPFRHQPKVA